MIDKQSFKLSNEQKDKIIDHLNGKGHKDCPSCGHDNMFVADYLIAPTVYHPTKGLTVLTGMNYPMAILFCPNCYHAQFFAAIPMGIVKSDKPEELGPNDG